MKVLHTDGTVKSLDVFGAVTGSRFQSVTLKGEDFKSLHNATPEQQQFWISTMLTRFPAIEVDESKVDEALLEYFIINSRKK